MNPVEMRANEDSPQSTVRPIPIGMLREQKPRHQEVHPEPQGQPGAEHLKGNKEPKPKKRLIYKVKTVVSHCGQRRLGVVDAMKSPEITIGMPPPVAPITHELRDHDHCNDLQDGRHRRKQVHLHPGRIGDDQTIESSVEPRKEKDVIETAIVEYELQEIDPEGRRSIADLPILA